jgi:hypothetical protein
MDAVIQGTIHLIYFAVGGNACPASPRLDQELCRNQSIEIGGFVQASKKCPKG